MPNDTVRANATGLPETDRLPPAPPSPHLDPPAPRNCRAYQLGAAMGRLATTISARRDPSAVTGDEREVLRMEERMDALAQALTYAAAESLSGALAQVIVSFNQVTGVIECPELDRDEVLRELAGVQRCLFSIADVLTARGAVPAFRLGGDRLMPPSLSLLPTSSRLADPLGQSLAFYGHGEVA